MSKSKPQHLQAINQAFAWWSRLGLLCLGIAYLYAKQPDFLHVEDIMLVSAPLLYFVATLLLSRSKLSEKEWISAILLPTDGAMLGALAAYGVTNMGLLFMSLIMLINSITDTRRAQSARAALAFTAAFAVVQIYIHPALELGTFDLSAWITLGGFVVFSAAHLMAFKYQQMRQISQIKQLERDHTQLKLKTYQILKYLPAPLRDRLAKQRDIEAKTSRKKLTIFFSDVVGFSELAEEMEANELSGLLNSYLTEMSEVADRHGGTVDKFMGDGIMIFFGDPQSKGAKEDAVACVRMSVEMRRRMNLLQVKWREEGIAPNLHVRMGINSGYATVGNFGSNDRLDYTVLGTEVNLASRLETAAEPGEILISSSTFLLTQDKFSCSDKGEIKVKGFSESIRVFSVEDSNENLKKSTTFVNKVSEGFSIYLDLDNTPHYDLPKIIDYLEKTIKLIKKNN